MDDLDLKEIAVAKAASALGGHKNQVSQPLPRHTHVSHVLLFRVASIGVRPHPPVTGGARSSGTSTKAQAPCPQLERSLRQMGTGCDRNDSALKEVTRASAALPEWTPSRPLTRIRHSRKALFTLVHKRVLPAQTSTPLWLFALLLLVGPASEASAAGWLEEGVSSPDGWVATEFLEHAEFIRITFESGGNSTSVEVTVRDGTDAVIQPGPGASPPPALIQWVTEAWESRPEAEEGAPAGLLTTTPRSPVWIALIAIALLTVVRSRPPNEWPKQRSLVVGGTVAVFAFGYLSVFLPDVPLIGDTCRDLQLARDCLLGLCGAGARAGFGELQQGTLWLRFLGTLLTLGVSVASIPAVINALHALTAGVAALLFAERGGWLAGLGAGLGTIVCLFHSEALGYLWNPTVIPFASLVAAVATLKAFRSRDWRDFVLVGVTVWLVAEAHVIGWVLLPAAAALAGAQAKRAIPSGAGLIASAVLCHLAVSPDAASTNLAIAGAELVGLTVVAFAAGFAMRRFELVTEDRAMLAVGVGFALAIPAALILFGEIRLRYAAPGFGFLLFGLRAYVAPKAARLLPAVALVAFGLAPPSNSDSPLIMASETEVLQQLASCGEYDECVWSLHASPRFPFVRMLDATGVGSEYSPAPALTFVPLVSAIEGPDWSWVPAASGGFAVRGYEPWVHRRDADACSMAGECVRLRPSPLPGMHYMRTGAVMPLRNGYGTPSRFEFPIRVPAHEMGESREIVLWAPLDESCRVEIIEVKGLEYQGTLPSHAVSLTASSSSGELVVEIGEACAHDYVMTPPTWVEAPRVPAAVRESIGR